jgi:hypothetical protein
MAVPVIVIRVAASSSKTPVVTTIVVGKVIVTAPELSSAAAFGKITASHMWSIPHAMWSISAHPGQNFFAAARRLANARSEHASQAHRRG